MAINGSKVVTRQVENLRDAASRAKDLAADVAAVMHEQILPYYEEGEIPIDFHLLQIVTGRWINGMNSGLSDNQYQRHHLRSLNRHLREEIKSAASSLRKVMTEIRFGLDVAIGVEATSAYFEGRSSLSRLTAPNMERVAGKLQLLFDDSKFGWEGLPERTRSSLQSLRQALGEERGKLQAALELSRPERSALLHVSGAYQREYLGKGGRLRRAVDMLQGLYEAAGFDLEAAMLSPSRTRSRRPDEEKPAGTGTPALAPISVTAPSVPLLPSASAPIPRLSRKERKRRRRQAAIQG